MPEVKLFRLLSAIRITSGGQHGNRVGYGDDARPVPATAENLARVRQGQLRVRQRPGDEQRFRPRQVRVPERRERLHARDTGGAALQPVPPRLEPRLRASEDPVALAAWVLEDRSEWPRERILDAMNGQATVTVNLRRPIQVILFYITAVVMPDDGTVRFAEDIYAHDARLEKALAASLSATR